MESEMFSHSDLLLILFLQKIPLIILHANQQLAF